MNSCTGPSWPTTLGMRTEAAISSISAARFVSTCASTLRIMSSIALPFLPRVVASRVYADTAGGVRCRLDQAQARQADITHRARHAADLRDIARPVEHQPHTTRP